MTDVSLRLYCQGIGDCTLIGIPTADGNRYWMLIDCGIHTSARDGPATIARVAADLRRLTDRIDVIVGTHEHWDHLSGFLTSNDIFKTFTVGEVWLAWTEDPANDAARKLDKYKGMALDTLAQVATRANFLPGQEALASGLDALLGFGFGITGDRVRSARTKLTDLGKSVRYLEPGMVTPLGASGVTAYVLGPPHDLAMLGLTDSKSDTYGFGVDSGWAAASALGNTLAILGGTMGPGDDPNAPFDDTEGLPLSALPTGADDSGRFFSDHYGGAVPAKLLPAGTSNDHEAPTSDQSWRRIDNDWLGVASQLALQLDSRTNNSSLVLALEIEATGHVLLFAADAQIGNWRSWKDVKFQKAGKQVTALDLLARTVFYKVGHHGSSNATRSTEGLEAMTHPDLVAFIPTDETMATKVGWGAIPAPGLLKRLEDRTQRRVIRADQLANVTIGNPAGVTGVDQSKAPLFVDMIIR
jgi:hypothetical protein